jgi:3-oxoacyl-[acyl-carrier-protein] synthase II
MMQTRVVVTGMGVVSPLGIDISTMWGGIVQGQSGIGPITLFDTSEFDVRIAGEVRGFDPSQFMSAKEARRMDRFTQFAICSLVQALEQSSLEVDDRNADDIGAIVGTGMGGIWTYTRELGVLEQNGPRRVSPFLIPSITGDALGAQIAMRIGIRGPTYCIGSSCATGTDNIGDAYEMIRRGHAKAMIAGGFEAAITPIGIAAFDRMRALSRRNDHPQAASRPFDIDRDGFVMSEGGALLILEEMGYALARGTEPLAEIIGYAGTSDAEHITTPDPNGMNASRCIGLALDRAGISPHQVDYINAHGTGTPSGDPAETQAIKGAFGDYAYQVPVSSTKSMTGHLLGGVGALEAVICIQAIRTRTIPPTINLEKPDPLCDLDYVPGEARKAELRVVLSNSFGFGGHNVSILFKRMG